jgi:hypothetical protein
MAAVGQFKGARTTFHTTILVHQPDFFSVHGKYPVGADDLAGSAAHTEILLVFEGGHAGQVSELFHDSLLGVN